MALIPPSSRSRYRTYRGQLKNRHVNRSGSSTPGGKPVSRRRHRSFFELFARFWGLLGEHRRMLIVALFFLTVAISLHLVPFYASKIVFDTVLSDRPLPVELPGWLPIPTGRRELLTFLALACIGLTIASHLTGLWSRWQSTRISKLLQVDVRRQVFEHAVRLPLHRVYALKSGGMASILRDDAGGVADLLFTMLYNPCWASVQLIGSLAVLAWVDWRLLLGAIVLLPFIYITHQMWLSRIRPLHRDIRASRQQIDSEATETFGGMRIVRGFSRQRSEVTRFTRNTDFMARQEIYAWWWMRAVDIAWGILIPLASATLLWYGGLRILEDRARVDAGLISPVDALTVGDLVMFLGYLTALLSPLEVLATSATTFQNNLAGLDRVLDLLEEPPEIVPNPGAEVVQRERVAGRITLRDISFSYPGSDVRVLKNINLEVKPGEIVALVGPSGAGKTTLCNLIARFYDPTQGSIYLDGRDLRDLEIDSYRRLLGIVEQDTFLFDGTIADNIGYGRRDSIMEEVIEAAQLANAHDFISTLPLGYETVIGERGMKLSGGQRQRLTIARAILADPRILILDEATSHLDTESERLIQNSLGALMSGRTSFVIAHRLSTIAHADRIVVMENGAILEQGPHSELMQQSGRYRQMVELQTQPAANSINEDIEALGLG